MKNEIEEKDPYDLKLDLSLKALKDCQEETKTTSCMKCNKIINCQTRDLYVDAVYKSMSKGRSGGFDF